MRPKLGPESEVGVDQAFVGGLALDVAPNTGGADGGRLSIEANGRAPATLPAVVSDAEPKNFTFSADLTLCVLPPLSVENVQNRPVTLTNSRRSPGFLLG